MRDYKHVKVPRKYRTSSSRTAIKRVEAGPGRRRKGGGIKSRFLTALFLVAAAGGAWLAWQGYRQLTQGEIFLVSGVDVEGVHRTGDAELRNIVGEFRGQNIFRADLDAAARRARRNPWIKEVRLHRSLPNRITMSVVERVPCAVLDTDAGRYLIDNEAVVIEREPNSDVARPSLPMIVARDHRPRPGETVISESVAEALTVLSEIQARGGWNMAELTVRAGSPESLSVVYADHEFKLGSGRYPEKLRRLAEIMADVKERGLIIAYVDLRPETQAAVMVKQAAGAAAAGKNANKSRPVRGRH
jgi:cell division protein FtsQ